MTTEKKKYRGPKIEDFGTVADLTAAIGASNLADQSEFPQQFPPGTGSYDVCNNDTPGEVC